MRRIIAISGVTTVAFGLSALAAVPATAAEGTWVQQYQRSSATETCGAQPGQTPWQASYSGQEAWTGSWAQWANGGNGGWICTRTIVWAKAPAPASDPVNY